MIRALEESFQPCANHPEWKHTRNVIHELLDMIFSEIRGEFRPTGKSFNQKVRDILHNMYYV